MNGKTFVQSILFMFVVVGLSATGQAFGQSGVRDAGSKMRGDYGGTSRTTARARSTYRPSAPMVVTDAAPEVAQAPSGQRRYSNEPSQAAPANGCPQHHAVPAAPETAENQAPTARRYSFEPAPEATRVYSAPTTRRGFGGSGFPDAGSKMRGDYGR